MSKTLFRSTSFSLRHLVDNIQRGDIALPELQRPFVWANTKVRDLFDSMYRGFPVGYLLFWETGVESGARQIGLGAKDARVARWLIVDGQQRMTSLYSVMTGDQVIRDDYSQSRVRLAFRPRGAHFAVWDASIERSPEYVSDITSLWSDFRATTSKFFERYESARGPLDNSLRRDFEDALDRVRDLQNYPFNVVELDSAVDEEQVAEVFVRINSEGVKLNQADFILTLMSVFWDEGRADLEEFSRKAKIPSTTGASPFNWYLAPTPDQLLRVSIALAFDRAVLRHAYSILRGKDLETGARSNERRDEQFVRLQEAQAHVLNLTNWHEYLRALERAGYRSSKMISSSNAVLYTYAIWLRGRVKYTVAVDELREITARWFFMAHLTSRYSGSFESQTESDFQRLDELAAELGYVRALDRLINEKLTADFWTITLPAELSTAASRSPALFGYFAALNILDADALLSTGRVRERLDPAVISTKGIERHHLFPKAYLKNSLGIKDNRQINQIANMALVEWNDNIAILDAAPAEYWPREVEKKRTRITPERLSSQTLVHALPEHWTELSYGDFLTERRVLMAEVVRDAFEHLADHSYTSEYPAPSAISPASAAKPADDETPPGSHVSIADLLAAGLLEPGAVLVPTRASLDAIAEVDEAGNVIVDDVTYASPSSAAMAAAGTQSENGWRFWTVDGPEGARLNDLRKRYRMENFDRTA